MKRIGTKILALCLAICMIASLGITAAAADDVATIRLTKIPDANQLKAELTVAAPTDKEEKALGLSESELQALRFVCILTVDHEDLTLEAKDDYMDEVGHNYFTYVSGDIDISGFPVEGVKGVKLVYQLKQGTTYGEVKGKTISFLSDPMTGEGRVDANAYVFVTTDTSNANKLLVAKGAGPFTFVNPSNVIEPTESEPPKAPADIEVEQTEEVEPSTNPDDQTVTETYTPDEKSLTPGTSGIIRPSAKAGYRVKSVKIVDKDGNVVGTTEYEGDGDFGYTMPEGAAAVEVEYEKVPFLPEESAIDKLLQTKTHIAYIKGDDQGNFRPDDTIKRCEVAVIFYRLLKNQNVTINSTFPDVAEDAWYATEVNTLKALNIFKGDDQGNFRPDDSITRAEFAAVCNRFSDQASGNTTNPFSDVTEDMWSYNDILQTVGFGWMSGYDDGTFRPDKQLTRQEAVKVINRVLGRIADQTKIDAGSFNPFKDVSTANWGYYDILEATVTHEAEFDEVTYTETWKSVA